jgi:hypothetical protein
MPPHKLQKFDSKHVSAGIFGGVEAVMDKGAREEVAEEAPEVRVKVEKDNSTGTIQNTVVEKALDNGDQKSEMVEEAFDVRVEEERSGSKAAEIEAEHGKNDDDDIQYLGHRLAKENSDDVPTVFAMERVNVHREEEKRRSNALLMGKLAYETSRQAKKVYSDIFDNMKPKDARMWVEEWHDDVVVLKTPSKATTTISPHLSPMKRTILQFDRKPIKSLQVKQPDTPNKLLQNRKPDTPIQEKTLTPLKRKQLEAKAAWAAGYAEKIQGQRFVNPQRLHHHADGSHRHGASAPRYFYLNLTHYPNPNPLCLPRNTGAFASSSSGLARFNERTSSSRGILILIPNLHPQP